MHRKAVAVLVVCWLLVAAGCSSVALAKPEAEKAKLVGGKPPKVKSVPKRQAASQGAHVKLAVRWTKHVHLNNLAELGTYKALIRTPLADCRELAAMMSPGNADTEARPPCTCADYFGIEEGAYWPKTTAEMNWVMSCDFRCEPLRWLHEARPARVSYLGEFHLSENTLHNLPPNLAPPSMANLMDRDAGGPNQDAWQQVLMGAQVKQIDTNTVKIMQDDFETTLMLLAWGDSNADGIEDVLVWAEHQATGGTLRFGTTHTLTRLKPNSPATLIEKKSTGQPMD